MHLPASSPHCLLSALSFSSAPRCSFVCQFVCNFPSVCVTSLDVFVSRPVGRFMTAGLLWLKLPQASKGKERDRLCHIMRALLSRLWLRVVIQNWCIDEPVLTSCQRRMFSTGRQASGDDNVGYARWALTTRCTLWHTWLYLTQCLLLSLGEIDWKALTDRIQIWVKHKPHISPVAFEEFQNFLAVYFEPIMSKYVLFLVMKLKCASFTVVENTQDYNILCCRGVMVIYSLYC